jgi:Ni/Co efflux regulator RcnB
MQKIYWTSLALVCALGLSQGSALAQPGRDNAFKCQPGERGCERGDPRGNQRGDQRGDGGAYGPGNARDYGRRVPLYQDSRRADLERRDDGDQRNDRRDYGDRGAGPAHDFYKGGRLPAYYRNRQYVVNDWRGHGLRSPPRGYQWVQTGGDYVLVAIATGIIFELLLNR